MNRRLSTAGIALALALAASACSASAQSGGSSAGSADRSSGSEIPVGVIGSWTGPAASSVADGEQSIRAWAASVNDAGGINGRKVHLYIEDDKGNTQAGVTAVKRLVEQNKVVAIVGQQAASSEEAWAPYVERKGVPVVGGGANNPPYLVNPDFFATGGNLISMFAGVVGNAKYSGKTLGSLYCAELAACASNPTLLKALGKGDSVTVPYASKVSATAPDYTAVCQGIKSSGVPAYTMGLAASVLKLVASQCRQQGVTATLILPDVIDTSFLKIPSFEGVQIADTDFPFFDTSVPSRKAFHDALAKYAPDLGSDQHPLNTVIGEEWAAGKLFEAAVKASGSAAVTANSVTTGLYSLHDETLDGLTMPLNFMKGKANLHNCWFSYTIKDEKFSLLDNGKPQCGDDAVIGAIAAKLG